MTIIYIILFFLFLLLITKSFPNLYECFENTITLSSDTIQNLITDINPNQDKINDNTPNQILINFPKFYPITTNFDPEYSNYNNLLSNTSISIINEILSNTINKANADTPIIYFNPTLKPVSSLPLIEANIDDYAQYIVSIMNSVSIINNSFTFKKAIPISKEQSENQVRINFHLEVVYNYPKSKIVQLEMTPDDFPLILNVVILFEKLYQNEDLFFDTVQDKTTNIYLETLTLMDITNSGYLPGNYTKNKV